jgi:hypothetical protein
VGGEGVPGAAPAGDDLVEHEQDAARVAELAQALEVAARRRQAAGRARDRLDEDGGDVRAADEGAEPREVVGELAALLRLARHEAVLRERGVPHVHDARHARSEALAVLHDARERDAAHVDAVVGALARHEHRALPFAARAVVGEGDLHRGVDGLGAGVREEDPVEPCGREARDARRELEGLRVRAREGRRVVELEELVVDGVGDLAAPVAEGYAEESGAAVEELAAVVRPVVDALGAGEEPRVLLEVTVRRERKPEVLERGPSHGYYFDQFGAVITTLFQFFVLTMLLYYRRVFLRFL